MTNTIEAYNVARTVTNALLSNTTGGYNVATRHAGAQLQHFRLTRNVANNF